MHNSICGGCNLRGFNGDLNSCGGSSSAYTWFLFGCWTSISVRGVAAIFDSGGPSTSCFVINFRISSTLVGVSGCCTILGNAGIGINDCSGSSWSGGGNFVGFENNDDGFIDTDNDDDDRPFVSGAPMPVADDDEYFCSFDNRTPFCICGDIFNCGCGVIPLIWTYLAEWKIRKIEKIISTHFWCQMFWTYIMFVNRWRLSACVVATSSIIC